jgi:hypothetical protein
MVHNGRRKTIKKRFSQDKGWRDEMLALEKAVKTGEPPIPYEHLIGVTKASFAAVESLRSGEKVNF